MAQVITSLDELLKFLRLEYDPTLPNPRECRTPFCLKKIPMDPRRSMSSGERQDHITQVQVTKYNKIVITYEGRSLEIWESGI